ncbi:MAG: hypothetical protein KKE29_13540 [Proteobacteria bacterium]|nr:hypothetical protein [Pseudomonadota bacterium]
MCRLVVFLMAVGAGALCLLGLAAMSLAAYLDDPFMFISVLGLWCLCGLLFNRWMLGPFKHKNNEIERLWLWSLAGCWAWPMGVVCGMALRLAPPEKVDS